MLNYRALEVSAILGGALACRSPPRLVRIAAQPIRSGKSIRRHAEGESEGHGRGRWGLRLAADEGHGNLRAGLANAIARIADHAMRAYASMLTRPCRKQAAATRQRPSTYRET